ncbi:MAG: hypothetical protein FJY99_10770 [Candidatus Sericytochromatia bacterium]|nr:hypothetical protein [Candidatus Tanganyikabacteria bacterium]
MNGKSWPAPKRRKYRAANAFTRTQGRSAWRHLAYALAGIGVACSPAVTVEPAAPVSAVGPTGAPSAAPNPALSAIPSPVPVPTAGVVPKPSATLRFIRPGRLAPDDKGPVDRHHDYFFGHDGTFSQFVWIPRFTAYQLLEPARAGHPGKPVGYWVEGKPVGEAGVVWSSEEFGGFYAAKFEASRLDAVPGEVGSGAGATAGTSSRAKVARRCVPWATVDYDESMAACALMGLHAHMMHDEEWTALAVWALIHGVEVRGNNRLGVDADEPGIAFLTDPTNELRTLTGTGRNPDWPTEVNTTSHTGLEDGVLDLNGNVNEWTQELHVDEAYQMLILDVPTGLEAPGKGYVVGLATDPRFRRYGLPITANGSSTWFSGDFFNRQKVDTRAMRGGTWGDEDRSGLWNTYLNCLRTFRLPNGGFRPCLTYD